MDVIPKPFGPDVLLAIVEDRRRSALAQVSFSHNFRCWLKRRPLGRNWRMNSSMMAIASTCASHEARCGC
jgi:hypothetical protein